MFMDLLDTLIIGSGPAGLSAAIYAKRANLSVLVAEKDYMGTGQISESGEVDNYLGLPGINGFDLGEAFLNHAKKLDVEFYEGMADGFERDAGGWSVHFSDGKKIAAKTVIYCAGAVHRHLDIEGEREFTGKGVSYCAVCDGAFYKGKTAAVVGGGDTALGDALYLSDLCDKVYLIHRRDQFRGSARTVERLKSMENVEIITNAVPERINGSQTVTALELKDGRPVAVNGVFVAVGMKPLTDVLKGVVDLDDGGYVIADETCATSAPGFFVAGDVRAKALRQVVTAVSDGANAAVAAAEYIMERYPKES